jgi:hypothetical protein
MNINAATLAKNDVFISIAFSTKGCRPQKGRNNLFCKVPTGATQPSAKKTGLTEGNPSAPPTHQPGVG